MGHYGCTALCYTVLTYHFGLGLNEDPFVALALGALSFKIKLSFLNKEARMKKQGEARRIYGVIPPLLTAFDAQGDFDEKAQREIVAFLVDKVHGFYICGTYGSGPLMEVDERKRVAEVIIDEVNGRIPVIVHVGAISTHSAVELAKHAERAGATAVAAVPPFYYPFKEPEVERHFKALVESVSIPVFVYNNPRTTGVPITPDFLGRLAGLGIAGVKDSSFDIMVFYDYLRKVNKPNFIFIIGTEALMLPAIAMGAYGAVPGLANALPEPVVELFTEIKEKGATNKARELQLKVSAMRETVHHYGPTIPLLHAILQRRGINAGHPRLPYVLPPKDVVDQAIDALKQLGASL
jgi:dihydrodipicolinate synthase/N-acetylneuraminate lyase